MSSILLRVRGDQNNYHDFELVFETENIQANTVAGTALLTINTTLKVVAHLKDDFFRTQPTLFDLNGMLTYNRLTLPMRPLTSFPFGVLGSYALPLTLAFELTRSQLQYLENERAKSGRNADMTFIIALHGKVTQHLTESDGTRTMYFNEISTSNVPNATFRIARSDWLDRILLGLGYDETILIELLVPDIPGVSGQVSAAMQYLETARQRLRDEQFRHAVHCCREAKDALTNRNPNEVMNLLGPLIGETKAAVVDNVLRAFGNLYNASSHPAPQPPDVRIEFTRDDAVFAVNTLTFVLDYVAQALQTQGGVVELKTS